MRLPMKKHEESAKSVAFEHTNEMSTDRQLGIRQLSAFSVGWVPCIVGSEHALLFLHIRIP